MGILPLILDSTRRWPPALRKLYPPLDPAELLESFVIVSYCEPDEDPLGP